MTWRRTPPKNGGEDHWMRCQILMPGKRPESREMLEIRLAPESHCFFPLNGRQAACRLTGMAWRKDG